MPSVAVVEHQESCPPALLGEWLQAEGVDLEVVRPYAGDDLPDLTSYDGVLVLGGEMSANDDDTVAWLAPLKQQLRKVVPAGVPTLGVCLGHQLLGVALGGVVEKNPRGQTVGLQPIGWEASGPDPLYGDLSGVRAIHWNGDVITRVPEGATVLARTGDGAPQVVRFAERAWGVQAHPEADVDVVRRWAQSDREDHVRLGIDQDGALDAIAAARDELERHWRPVAARFAALVGGVTR
jgi:GMP synthase (glutamine-hydrolysing)